MAWTTLEIIKKHLQESGVEVDSICNEFHVLTGTEEEQLEHAYLTDKSETVKTIDSATPYYDGENKLSGTSWKSLDHEQIVPGALVAASNTLLTTIYIEGVDFVVEYPTGRIRRIEGGAISDGSMVCIWYQYYTVHTKDTDYTINYESGRLARIDGGEIADGSPVWVDYKISAVTVADSLINQAIVEVEGKILDRLSSDYSEESTDQGLKTGSTELTLSIVTREMSAETMRKYPSSQAGPLAKQWRNLSIRYEEQAWETLSPFLVSPALHGAKVQVNISRDNE